MMHQQSLYSFLHDSKLDCFGVAFTTVAGCQLLGYKDVNLSLSEDHVWLNFGKTGDETIEITWHGKGAEDKRGQSVVPGIESQSWIYVNGYAVICDRVTEVVAMCASINPSLSQSSVCLELSDLQQQLLWMLYELGALKRYPMAMGCLAELEEVNPTENRPTAESLYKEAGVAGKKYYKNHHVYPSVALAGYYYRKNDYKNAFGAWADAGDVIRLYNYCRDDEEIYKEFLDIGITIIPAIMKSESGHSGHSILRDPLGFANLLRWVESCIRRF
jgi:menin